MDRSGECHLWSGSVRNDAGYGQFWDGERIVLAHRAAWMFAHGPIPTGRRVLHTCDTPLCVRDDHLFLGSQADNLADMRAKGRAAAMPGTKLTRADAAAIRRRCAAGETQDTVAADFNICRSNVSCIVRGLTWKGA